MNGKLCENASGTSLCGSRSESAESRCTGYPLASRFCDCFEASQSDVFTQSDRHN